jgi:hypothetical protein
MNEKLKAVIEEHKVLVAGYDCHSESDWEHEDFVVNMTESLKDMGSVWDIECRNANWRGSTGYMTSSDPDKVISAILMHDGQCNTEVWEGENNTLEGVCYHHDCPTGSWFTIKKR